MSSASPVHWIRTFTVAAVCLFSACVLAQSKPLGAQLRVRWDGFNIIVIKDDVKHSISVDDKIEAYSLNSVKLLSAKVSGQFVYLLFDIKGQTRGPEEAEHYCGAGEERSLLWIKLDPGWNKISSQSFAIESCWYTASLDDEGGPVTFNGPDLVARGTTYRDPSQENVIENYKLRRYEIRYSLKHPESGLQVRLVPQDTGFAK